MTAKTGKIALIYALSAGVALACAECYVRATRSHITPEVLAQRSLKYVPAVFARHLLAAERRTVSLEPWGAQSLQINSTGYRGGEFETARTPGVIRVMVFGGSAVFDPFQPTHHDWPALVGRRLRRLGYSIEVINAGVPGHASCDSLGRFLTEGHTFAPDIVLLYNAWNDIKLFHESRPLLRVLRPYVEGSDPRLTYAGYADRWLSELSQVYVRLRMRYLDWTLGAGLEGTLERAAQRKEIAPSAVQQFRFTASVFVRAVRAAGALPVLVTQARLVSPSNSESERERIAYGYVRLNQDDLIHAFELTDQALASVARAEEAVLIDTSAEMTGVPEFFADQVHLSKAGSERLATLVANKIEPLLERR